MNRVAVIVCMLLLSALAAPAPGSPQTESAIKLGYHATHVPLGSPDAGHMFPQHWIIVAGEVTAYSANLGERVPAPEAAEEVDVWVKVRVDKPVFRARSGEFLTVWFRQMRYEKNSFPFRASVSDTLRFIGGEKLLIVARRAKGRFELVDDIYPIQDYEAPIVKACAEYVRIDGLTGQGKLEALADAALRPENAVLRFQLTESFSHRVYAAHKQVWAVDRMARLALTPNSNQRMAALELAERLFSPERVDAVSRRVLGLYEKLLRDPTLPSRDKAHILEHFHGMAVTYWSSVRVEGGKFVGPSTETTTFRLRFLQIVESFLKTEKDPQLRKEAEEQRRILMRDKRAATKVIRG